MSLGNGNPKSGDKGSNFNYEIKALQGLESIAKKLETGIVKKIVAGTGVTISPTTGVGNVTINASATPQVGYRGFKYNMVQTLDPNQVPTFGQVLIIVYDDGEGSIYYSGLAISMYDANSVYLGDTLAFLNNQSVTVTPASPPYPAGSYFVVGGQAQYNFQNFGSYVRILGGNTSGYLVYGPDVSGVVYLDFQTSSSNAGTVTSVSALTLGTTGTDLSSTVATSTTTPVITLNVPTASATNRGALSAANWSTFNGKQDALVSGTNIKTINGTSVLGSGNLVISSGPTVYTANVGTSVNSGSYIPSISILIPANTLTATSVIEITCKYVKASSAAGAYIFPAIFLGSTASSITSVIALGPDMNPGYQTITMVRTFNLTSSTSMIGLNAFSYVPDDYINSTMTTTTVNVNIAANMYINFALNTLSTAGVCQSAKVTIY